MSAAVLEVRVLSAATGGLEIIEHIPAVRPCRLEGRNGVGKSALIRLLLLISGEQPYPTDLSSWRSMRSLIGPTEVTINGLEGEFSTATVRLTPLQWPEDHAPIKIEDWLGTLTLDGKDVPIGELFDLFHVVHLSGTERLADTLTQQTDRLAAALADIEARLDGLNDNRVALGKMADELRFLSPREADAERKLLEAATADRRRVATDLETMRPRAQDLRRAYALAVMVQSGGAAQHEHKLLTLREELEKARTRMHEAERNRDAAVAALAKGSSAQQQVAKRERRLGTIQKAMDKLLARQEELGAQLEALGIPASVDLLAPQERAALDEKVNEALVRQRQLQVQAARHHRTSAENQVLDDIRVVLDDAVADGLSDTILARVHEQDITVSELRGGLGFLAEIDDSELVELSHAAQELAQLTELKELFAQRKTLQEEHRKLRLELQQLEPEAASHDELRKQATEAREALDKASAEVRAYNVEIGALSRSVLGGAEAVADVSAHVQELVAKHAVDAGQLPTALSEAESMVMELQAQEEKLGREIERLVSNRTRRRVGRESFRRQSEHDQRMLWLGRLAARVTPASRQGRGDWTDETWQRLSDHITASKDAYDRLYTQISGLHVIAAESRIQKGHGSPLGGALKAVVEAEALAEFSATPIVDALFDGGEVRRVSLDEGASTITWTTPSGETRTRPLTAFSSGEQALGFMRARLQQIADRPMSNRFVFLDEFGAFISADRRRPLAELLTSHELEALGEQVIVVLPLQSDYENELGETTGELHELYAERVRAIEQQGYFTEAFAR